MESKKKTILIIEDNEDNMFLFREMLELGANYKVFTARKGKDGIKLLKAKLPDLVILDIFLKDMSGFEIKDIIKNDPKLTKTIILAVSASVTKEEREIFKRELIYFIDKPINVRKFMETVDKLLKA